MIHRGESDVLCPAAAADCITGGVLRWETGLEDPCQARRGGRVEAWVHHIVLPAGGFRLGARRDRSIAQAANPLHHQSNHGRLQALAYRLERIPGAQIQMMVEENGTGIDASVHEVKCEADAW
jgi:hypothetical protein